MLSSISGAYVEPLHCPKFLSQYIFLLSTFCILLMFLSILSISSYIDLPLRYAQNTVFFLIKIIISSSLFNIVKIYNFTTAFSYSTRVQILQSLLLLSLLLPRLHSHRRLRKIRRQSITED